MCFARQLFNEHLSIFLLAVMMGLVKVFRWPSKPFFFSTRRFLESQCAEVHLAGFQTSRDKNVANLQVDVIRAIFVV